MFRVQPGEAGGRHNEKVPEILPFSKIDLRGDSFMRDIFENGKTFDVKMLKISQNSKYIVQFENFFSIISSKNEKVQYLANRIPLC